MNATNKVDKNLYKLMINAAYGKTMENKRKRMKIRIVTNEKILLNIHLNLHISDIKKLATTFMQFTKKKK